MYNSQSLMQMPCAEQRISALRAIWENPPINENVQNRVKVAGHMVTTLYEMKKYLELDRFLASLPPDIFSHLQRLEKVFICMVYLRVHQAYFKEAFDMLQECHFPGDCQELVALWDEAHYRQKELIIKRPLTPLIRFRLRQKYPPPCNICPSGVRVTNSLPASARKILKEWLERHQENPYPSKPEKTQLAQETKLTVHQVRTWFANARRRQRQASLRKEKKAKERSQVKAAVPEMTPLPSMSSESHEESCASEIPTLYSNFEDFPRPLEANSPPGGSAINTPEPPPLPAEELLNSLGSLGTVSQSVDPLADVTQRYPELRRLCSTPPLNSDYMSCSGFAKGSGLVLSGGSSLQDPVQVLSKSWLPESYHSPPPPANLMYSYPSISPVTTNPNMSFQGARSLPQTGCTRLSTPLPPIGSWSNYNLYPSAPSSQMWFPRATFAPSWGGSITYSDLGYCAPPFKSENDYSSSGHYGYSTPLPNFSAPSFTSPSYSTPTSRPVATVPAISPTPSAALYPGLPAGPVYTSTPGSMNPGTAWPLSPLTSHPRMTNWMTDTPVTADGQQLSQKCSAVSTGSTNQSGVRMEQRYLGTYSAQTASQVRLVKHPTSKTVSEHPSEEEVAQALLNLSHM